MTSPPRWTPSPARDLGFREIAANGKTMWISPSIRDFSADQMYVEVVDDAAATPDVRDPVFIVVT
jgi:hypothetical protein